jgi:hypothetical protein
MDPRKQIFDAVRDAAPPGLFNDPGYILALDNLLDSFGVPRESTESAFDQALATVLHHEGGFVNHPRLCLYTHFTKSRYDKLIRFRGKNQRGLEDGERPFVETLLPEKQPGLRMLGPKLREQSVRQRLLQCALHTNEEGVGFIHSTPAQSRLKKLRAVRRSGGPQGWLGSLQGALQNATTAHYSRSLHLRARRQMRPLRGDIPACGFRPTPYQRGRKIVRPQQRHGRAISQGDRCGGGEVHPSMCQLPQDRAL